MTVGKLPEVSFADETGYDSDEFDNDTSSNASSSASGVILGFEDGELKASSREQQEKQPEAIQYEDEENLTVSRIGGRAVGSLLLHLRKGPRHPADQDFTLFSPCIVLPARRKLASTFGTKSMPTMFQSNVASYTDICSLAI